MCTGGANIGEPLFDDKYLFCHLFQREQEYAEARLRILGEARSPEEQLQIATNDR